MGKTECDIDVAVDARCLNKEHVRGIGKVLLGIIEHSPAEFNWKLYSNRPDLPINLPRRGRVETQVFESKGYRFNIWEQWSLPRRIKQSRPDIAFFPANTSPFWQPCPSVVVIHDTLPWEETGGSHRCSRLYMDYLLPSAFRKAKAIVTVSESSANDIRSRWPELDSKLVVILNGVDDLFFEETTFGELELPNGCRPPYFLYFGGCLPRKRLEWAVRIFEMAGLSDHDLVVCGLESGAVKSFRDGLPVAIQPRVKVLGFVEENKLPILYRRATAVLYPTLFEGFGLPIVESSACGTACLFSPIASMKELVGPGAIALPANDLDSWVEALRLLANCNGLQESVAKSAQEWATNFRWQKSAHRYCELFKKVASGE